MVIPPNVPRLIRMFGTGLPIWTALEVGILYVFANGHVPWLTFAANPWYLFALALVMPIIQSSVIVG